MWTDGRDTDGSPGQMAVTRTAATCVAVTRQMRERTGSERGGRLDGVAGAGGPDCGGERRLRKVSRRPREETCDSGCREEA